MNFEKEIIDLKEQLARRKIKSSKQDHEIIRLERELLRVSKELHNHKQNDYAHQT